MWCQAVYKHTISLGKSGPQGDVGPAGVPGQRGPIGPAGPSGEVKVVILFVFGLKISNLRIIL